MTVGRQTITNDRDVPIYVSIEPTPECYELDPGEKLTLIFQVPKVGNALEMHFINEREIVVWPGGQFDEPEVLINGASAEGRSWSFKHK
jgi:hypothetical protein